MLLPHDVTVQLFFAVNFRVNFCVNFCVNFLSKFYLNNCRNMIGRGESYDCLMTLDLRSILKLIYIQKTQFDLLLKFNAMN